MRDNKIIWNKRSDHSGTWVSRRETFSWSLLVDEKCRNIISFEHSKRTKCNWHQLFWKWLIGKIMKRSNCSGNIWGFPVSIQISIMVNFYQSCSFLWKYCHSLNVFGLQISISDDFLVKLHWEMFCMKNIFCENLS